MIVGRFRRGLVLSLLLAGGCASHRLATPVATTPKVSDLPTLEQHDAPLGSAIAALSASPSPGTHLQVAEQYLRLHIFDQAYDHFKDALKMDSRSAAAYDGLARLWRDSGFLEFGLTEASRAVYFAPTWAEAQNTLGTLLFALGNAPEAQRKFELALSLDPTAAYVHSNLCYLSFVRGDLSRARDQCTEALRLAPEFPAALANLAAVSAADGK